MDEILVNLFVLLKVYSPYMAIDLRGHILYIFYSPLFKNEEEVFLGVRPYQYSDH